MNIFDILSQFINAFTFLYLTFMFHKIFFEAKYEKWIMSLCFIAGVTVSTFSLLFLRGTIWNFAIILITNFAVTLLFKCKFLYKLTFGALIYAMQTICETGVGSIFSIVFGSFEALSSGLPFFIGMMASKIVIFMVIVLIKFKKMKGMGIYLNRNHSVLLLLPIATLTTYTWQAIIIFENHIDSDIYWFLTHVSCISLAISIIILFDFIDALYKNTINESRVIAANQIIEMQKAQYEVLINHNREVLKIQHDNKNFCIGLLDELEAGRISEAKQKLKNAHELYLEEQRIHSNIISFLVEIKAREAAKNDIEVCFDCEKLPHINIPSTDLAIILGNALDNAIEAASRCDGDKKVELFVSLRRENVVIVIKNPVIDKVDVNNLKTVKSDKAKHGFGIISMKNITEKYNGEIMLYEENGIFTTSIIMQNKADEQ